jgi:hypothetical protein
MTAYDFQSGQIGSASDLMTALGNPVGTAEGGTAQRFLMDRFAEKKNIRDYGAAGDGTTDDTAAINAASAAVASTGGVVEVPAGRYLFNDSLVVKANTVMEGPGTLIAAPPSAWTAMPTFLCIVNENHDAETITDENITIRGITLDMTEHGTSGVDIHGISIRKTRGVKIENVIILGGSSSVALRACDDTHEIGCRYINFTNCGSDHWDGPGNGRLVGCHLECDSSAQMINWNPEATVPPSAGLIADGFTVSGNTLVSHKPSTTPCQIEPLGTSGTFVRNVTITGNTFKNAWLVCRGDVDGLVIANNTFSDFATGSPAIMVQTDIDHPGTPGTVLIANNTIRDAITTSGNLGVIVAQTNKGIVIGNSILGTDYDSTAIYRGATACQVMANYIEDTDSQSSNRLQNGIIIPNGGGNLYGWTDASGSVPRMFLQGDNNWIFAATNASGGLRTVLSMFMRDNSSELIAYEAMQFYAANRYRVRAVAAAGTVIGTATVLSDNLNRVTSCTAGAADGVVLAAISGRFQTVVNSTADTLKVYPPNSDSAQIDAGGVGTATTIAPGKVKTFVQLAAGVVITTSAT